MLLTVPSYISNMYLLSDPMSDELKVAVIEQLPVPWITVSFVLLVQVALSSVEVKSVQVTLSSSGSSTVIE